LAWIIKKKRGKWGDLACCGKRNQKEDSCSPESISHEKGIHPAFRRAAEKRKGKHFTPSSDIAQKKGGGGRDQLKKDQGKGGTRLLPCRRGGGGREETLQREKRHPSILHSLTKEEKKGSLLFPVKGGESKVEVFI